MALGDFELIEESFVKAAIDPSQWVKALDVVAAVTRSQGAVLLPVTGNMISALPFTESIAGSFDTYIRDEWYQRDERNRGIDILKRRGIVDDLDLFSEDEIKRHPYYQEFLAPHGLRWFGGVRISCGTDLWCLSIQRRIDQAPFSQSEKDQLASLSKSLSGSAAIASAIGESIGLGALEAFEISNRGAALINRDGRIFKLNRIAEQLLKGDIRLVKGKIVADDRAACEQFERALGKLLNHPSSAIRPPIAFERKGRRPLLAYPAKLDGLTRNALADCQVVVIFVDMEMLPRPPKATLQVGFQLSEAEARLAVHLADGEPLEKAADYLGVAKETARSQLKSIFAKVGCHRQAELVAILSMFLKG